VRNRVRVRSRAADHLETFAARLEAPDIGGIRDRAIYMEVASKGLGIFDLPPSRIETIQSDWYPLIHFIEATG
jgi:chromosome partitioning protein